MPFKPRYDAGLAPTSVVDEDLRVLGPDRLFVCDMPVMPFSSAANPVRTLAALASGCRNILRDGILSAYCPRLRRT
jgi:choline dehydrogenase-like flavoprotein